MTKREIRRLLATKLMGWKRRRYNWCASFYVWDRGDTRPVIEEVAWRPCKNAAQASMILEKFAAEMKEGVEVYITIRHNGWRCVIEEDHPLEVRAWRADAPTFAEAVCTAIAEFVKEQQ